MTIVKIDPEWNNSHASLDDVEYLLHGWAEITETFLPIWMACKPFVDIGVDADGNITYMASAEEVKREELDPQPTTEDILSALLGVTE